LFHIEIKGRNLANGEYSLFEPKIRNQKKNVHQFPDLPSSYLRIQCPVPTGLGVQFKTDLLSSYDRIIHIDYLPQGENISLFVLMKRIAISMVPENTRKLPWVPLYTFLQKMS